MILLYRSNQLSRVGQDYRAPVLLDVFKQLHTHYILKADQWKRRCSMTYHKTSFCWYVCVLLLPFNMLQI